MLQAKQLSLVTCKIILAELFEIYKLYWEILSLGLDFSKDCWNVSQNTSIKLLFPLAFYVIYIDLIYPDFFD